jgi:hypothetical protein
MKLPQIVAGNCLSATRLQSATMCGWAGAARTHFPPPRDVADRVLLFSQACPGNIAGRRVSIQLVYNNEGLGEGRTRYNPLPAGSSPDFGVREAAPMRDAKEPPPLNHAASKSRAAHSWR